MHGTEGHSCTDTERHNFTDTSSLYRLAPIIYIFRGKTNAAPRGIVVLTHLPCMDLPPLSICLGENQQRTEGHSFTDTSSLYGLAAIIYLFREKTITASRGIVVLTPRGITVLTHLPCMDLPPLSIFLGENQHRTKGHSCTYTSSMYELAPIIYLFR